MVFASRPVLSRQPLGGPAGRRAERHANLLGAQDLEDGVDQRGLADAGAAGDHQHLAGRAPAAPPPAGWRPAQAGPALDPRDRLVRRRSPARAGGRRPAAAAARRCPARPGRARPGTRRGGPPTVSATTSPPSQLQRERRRRPARRDLQQLGGKRRSSSAGRPQWPSSIASASA